MSNEELALAIQQGEDGRTLELWEQVNGLVKRKAMQIMTALQLSGNPRGVEFDDLYQTGYLAMVAAVETYSPERGAFSTWFMFHLKTAFSEATGYRTKSGRCEPLNTAASLDRPVQPDEPDSGTLGELVPDSRAADAIENVEESVYHEQLHKAIDGAISELPPDNAQVLRLRYWDDMTLSAVGEVMGKSPERTRQMENKGIRELRKSRTLHRFFVFLDVLPHFLLYGIAVYAFQYFKFIRADVRFNRRNIFGWVVNHNSLCEVNAAFIGFICPDRMLMVNIGAHGDCPQNAIN